MEILITNDDGYKAGGIKVLVEIARQLGNVTVVAPKVHQSGMSMAVDLGLKKLAYKKLSHEDAHDGLGSVDWSYLDATPASCAKFGMNVIFDKHDPDLVLSGINHGSNAATASCYSGTLGAVHEAALRGVTGIGISLDCLDSDADFSAFRTYLPDIIRKIAENPAGKYGIFYNINFPDLPECEIKGVRAATMGQGKWVKEFMEWDEEALRRLAEESGVDLSSFSSSPIKELEEGETAYKMVGHFEHSPLNDGRSDICLNEDGYISVVAHNVDNTDRLEYSRMMGIGIDKDFR